MQQEIVRVEHVLKQLQFQLLLTAFSSQLDNFIATLSMLIVSAQIIRSEYYH